jgi:hypothetical protein
MLFFLNHHLDCSEKIAQLWVATTELQESGAFPAPRNSAILSSAPQIVEFVHILY